MDTCKQDSGFACHSRCTYHKTNDILPGDVILEEDLWLWSFHSRYHAKRCCSFCFKEVVPAESSTGETSLKQCAACKVTHYCGKDCQRLDWKCRHKHECAIHQHFWKKQHPLWLEDVPDRANSIECTQTVLVLASKVIEGIEAKQNKSEEEVQILEAYRKLPEVSDPTMMRGIGEDKSLAKQTNPETSRRVLPALLSLTRGDQTLEKYGMYGIGICLEMGRFGHHSCNPNAVAMLGEGRTVRVIATAAIASLSDVRLQRETRHFYVNLVHDVRRTGFIEIFGHECKCARCVVGDANDPIPMYQLRCPRSALCGGECKNMYYDGSHCTASHFALPFVVDSRTVAARLGDPWVKALAQKLTPCSVCGARYDARLIASDVAEVVTCSNSRTLYLKGIKTAGDQFSKSIVLAKRYLHSSSRAYKVLLQLKATALREYMAFAQMKRNLPDVDMTSLEGLAAFVTAENDDMKELFEMQLREIRNALTCHGSEAEQAVDLVDAFQLCGDMLVCIEFYKWRFSNGGADSQVCGQLLLLSSQIYDGAKIIVERVLTRQQAQKFFSKQ